MQQDMRCLCFQFWCHSLQDEILKYHVVSGNFSSKDVSQYESAKTLSNDIFKIVSKEDHIFINNAKVIAADVKASNGTIHIIDTVLVPESK